MTSSVHHIVFFFLYYEFFLYFHPKVLLISCHSCVQQLSRSHIAKFHKLSRFVQKEYIDKAEQALNLFPWWSLWCRLSYNFLLWYVRMTAVTISIFSTFLTPLIWRELKMVCSCLDCTEINECPKTAWVCPFWMSDYWALLKSTWALSKSIVGGDVDGCQWLTPIFAEEVLQQLMLLTTVNEHWMFAHT